MRWYTGKVYFPLLLLVRLPQVRSGRMRISCDVWGSVVEASAAGIVGVGDSAFLDSDGVHHLRVSGVYHRVGMIMMVEVEWMEEEVSKCR